MKRFWIIFSVIAALFAFLCMGSCNCDNDAELTVGTQGCSGFFCYEENGETTLEGCHYKSDKLDCYYFPSACGCYSNEFTDMEYFDGCMLPSCVICGFDLTLLEWYGHTENEEELDIDSREVTAAVEVVDYRIDSFKILVEDELSEFTNGKFNMEDVILFIQGLNLSDVVDIDVYIEYTALTELQSSEFNLNFAYKHDVGNMSPGIGVKKGNVKAFYGENNYKSRNIKEGKHMIHGTVSLNAYELLNMDLENPSWSFTAYKYSGGAN